MKHIHGLTHSPAKAQSSRVELKVDFMVEFSERVVIFIADLFGSGGLLPGGGA